ncbi:MAG: hypothetical protein A3F82_05105 [Deltaproteobacteria bacterium RIFCSPLOWO2_12_FULL_44_12]|nr:MAG: hypothetical protein A2712_06155 [Deltaproteobacteria bacterium RIFCSPHIGHO2_01_FULL_43_49]OGQ16711.1 MAG: hypothetical protein A3D22_07280 [Deltaproteobacteria bacterium RIFCSPHIGHO2_02_FULL_44_53]OGQ29849.1 MAG: hypothetical protein A3D98_09945 [Deltaproteobacteria bacterium RIFCSPHIGHO2_12_FULL_44_21]OGQ33139.1 MAG: hypothetical protein A2979_03925 [Deltaproteobacteria bacterium RIFCSPLOWO2_01_FULL_45_74]OGQ42234.1 MAG: hypothetical protein A3I70_06230 [Deltaproteobacteria bacterium 
MNNVLIFTGRAALYTEAAATAVLEAEGNDLALSVATAQAAMTMSSEANGALVSEFVRVEQTGDRDKIAKFIHKKIPRGIWVKAMSYVEGVLLPPAKVETKTDSVPVATAVFAGAQVYASGDVAVTPTSTRIRRVTRAKYNLIVGNIDQSGPGVGESLSQFLKSLHGIASPYAVAIGMGEGASEEMVAGMWEGTYLPCSREVMENLAHVLGLDDGQKDNLLTQWGLDWLRYYETFHSVPQDLKENEKAVLLAVRLAIIRDHDGSIRSVEGVKVATLRRYLEMGLFPEHTDQRFSFAEVLGGLVGRDFLRSNLGRSILGEYWQPSRFEDFENITKEYCNEWFETVEAQHSGEKTKTIVVQYLLNEQGGMGSFGPLLLGQANRHQRYGKIYIKKRNDGKFEVVGANSPTATEKAIHFLRNSTLARAGSLIIRSDGFLGFKTISPEEMEELEASHIEDWFDEVTDRQEGIEPRIIVWQFRLHPPYGIIAPEALAISEASEDKHYGQIYIRKTKKGNYEVAHVKGNASEKIVGHLRRSNIVFKGALHIPSDVYVGLRGLRLEDLDELRPSYIDSFFEQVGRNHGGILPEEIIWQFRPSAEGLGYLNLLAVGEESSNYGHYGYVRIRRNLKGSYEVVSAKGAQAREVTERLRGTDLVKSETLRVRGNGFLGLSAFRMAELNELTGDDIEGWFQEVAKKKGWRRGRTIIWQFQMQYGGTLSSQKALALGEEGLQRYLSKIKIQRVEEGRYRIVSGSKDHGVAKVVAQLRVSPVAQGETPALLFPDSPRTQKEIIQDLAVQVLSMSDTDFAIMRAGGLPPNTPAEALVQQMDKNIRYAAAKIVQTWAVRGVSLEFEDVYRLARAFLPLFLKENKWNPDLGHILFYLGYFKAHLERRLAKQYPLMHEQMKAWRTGGKSELEKRHLRPHKEPAHQSEEKPTIWDRISGEIDLVKQEQLMLAVAHALYDFLASTRVKQIEKEVFILRSRETLAKIGTVYNVVRERIRRIEVCAIQRCRPHVLRYLREIGMGDILDEKDKRATVETVRELRDIFSLEELGRIMARANFDRERWEFLAGQMPDVIPSPPK